MAELRARPHTALHVWDQSAHLQVRLDADVAFLLGAEAAGTWARVPEASRTSYGSIREPGQPIESALAHTKNIDSHAFAVLRLQVLTIDALLRGPEYRRARFDRSNGWQGLRLAPLRAQSVATASSASQESYWLLCLPLGSAPRMAGSNFISRCVRSVLHRL